MTLKEAAYALSFGIAQHGQEQAAEGMYFYGNYYAVQAMFLAGGEYWSGFYPAVRDQLIDAWQDKNAGNWKRRSRGCVRDVDGEADHPVQKMPNRYLPVYSGKGPGGGD